jgi:hypothetical protein
MPGDLFGPVTPPTLGGRCYIFLLIDNMSYYMWDVLLNTKAAAADAIK